MLTILEKTPLFVWPLLAVLIWGGLRATKKNSVPINVLLVIPTGFFIWSLITFFGRFGAEGVSVLLWVVALGSGFVIGYAHMHTLNLEFIHEKKMVMMPGSWIPLMLSLSIFSAKFSIGILTGMRPQLEGSLVIFSLELFSAVILGIFAGRGIGCLKRFRSSAPLA